MRGAAQNIAQHLIEHGEMTKHLDNEGVAQMMRTLTNSSDKSHTATQEVISDMAKSLLEIAGVEHDSRAISYTDRRGSISTINPKAFHALQGLASETNAAKMARAEQYAAQMLGVGVYTESIVGNDRSAAGVLGNLRGMARGFINEDVISAHGGAAVQMAEYQGFGSSEIDEINAHNLQEIRDNLTRSSNDLSHRNAMDVADDLVTPGAHPGGVPQVPNSSAANALRSGEFLSKLSKTKYFKPAAAIVGGLAGVEAIRSAIDKFTPGVVPSMGYSSANTMPPPPMISSPQDPTFAPDAMPNTNIARVSKPRGMRTSVNISGKMDNPVDFRGITNQHFLNNGYIPNIQGSFRSELNDTMSRGEISQHIGGQLNSAF